MTTSPVPSDTDRLAKIRARLDAASTSTTMDVHAGRATLRASVSGGDRGRFVGGMGDLVAATVGETGPLTVTVADDEDGQDATLALHARDDLAWLLEQNERLERKLIDWREAAEMAAKERDEWRKIAADQTAMERGRAENAAAEVASLQARLTTVEEQLTRLEAMRCEVCGRRVAHVNAYGHLIGWGCADGNECTDHDPSWADVREAVRAAGYRLRRRGPVQGDPALSRWSKTVRWDLEAVADDAETRGGFNLIYSWWHSEGGDEDPFVSVEIDLDDGSGTEIHLWSASPARAWGAAVAACAIDPAWALGLGEGDSR